MKVIESFDFIKDKIREHLIIDRETDDIINYNSIILVNPKTECVFPQFDKPFFDRMNATLKHILHCYKCGWIQSERQVFYSSNECLTTIQFVERNEYIQCNVFQRSSNINNLKEDIEFLNWFLKETFVDKKTELNVFVSMPHEFKNKKTKVD